MQTRYASNIVAPGKADLAAVLYDTVQGPTDWHNVEIPERAQVMQLIARDEMRNLFPSSPLGRNGGEMSPSWFERIGPGDHSDLGNNHDRGGLGDAFLKIGHDFMTQQLGLPLRAIPEAYSVNPDNLWIHDLSGNNGVPPPDNNPFTRPLNPAYRGYATGGLEPRADTSGSASDAFRTAERQYRSDLQTIQDIRDSYLSRTQQDVETNGFVRPEDHARFSAAYLRVGLDNPAVRSAYGVQETGGSVEPLNFGPRPATTRGSTTLLADTTSKDGAAHTTYMAQRFGWAFDGKAYAVPERLSLEAAATDYMQGNGIPVQVRGETVNLDYIEPARIQAVFDGGKPQLVADWNFQMRGADIEDRYVYGSVTARPDGKGGLQLQDKYDFEVHKQASEGGRNAATLAGDMMSRFVGGPYGNGSPLNLLKNGTPFPIQFIGSTPVPRGR